MLFTIEDGTYAYDVVGTGPPIVLLHGFTGTRHTWQSLVEVLRDTHQVITVDLPGHGQTKTCTERSMKQCCNDLQHLITHLGLSEVHLLGYSLGGRTALSFAIYYPEMVTSLILESASPGLEKPKDQEARQKHDHQLAKRLETEGIDAFVNYWEKIPLFETQQTLPQVIKQQIRHERRSQSAHQLACSLRAMGTGAQPSWWKKINDLKMPILLLVGALDAKFVAINHLMAKRMDTSHIHEVENSGHAIHVEQPDKFGKIVKRFLNHNHDVEENTDDDSMGTGSRI